MSNGDLPLEVEELSHSIIRCAIEVHRELGPGMLEKIYEDALVYELNHLGIAVRQQVEIVVPYKTTTLRGQRIDLIVDGLIIVELKSVAQTTDLHRAQLLSYLCATGLPLGLLFNFNVTWLREGLDRVFNERATACLAPSSTSRPSRSKD